MRLITRFKCLLITLLSLFIMPTFAFADTLLHDAAPGTIITFSGMQWVVLEQKTDGTTYILLNSNDGNRVFDPDNTQLFNPSNSNNIGYYLNNTFYNSLSQKDLIETHSWDIKFQDGTGNQTNVTSKIGLISYAEYQAYSTYYNGSILPSSYSYYWWTRTPNSGYSSSVYLVHTGGNLNYLNASNSRGVRPALYLKSGILLSDENEVIGEGSIDTTPPAKPSGLSASATSTSTVELSWNENTEPDFSSYNLYRDGVKIKGTAINSATDSGLTPDTTYTYTVTAVDSSGNESEHSSQVAVTTPQEMDTTPPAVPTGLTVEAINSTSVELSWNENTEPDFSSYNLYRDGVKINGTSINSATDSGLDPNTTYTYTVTSVDSTGNESTYSDAATVTTLAELPPSPESLNMSNITDITATLNWNPVEGAEGYNVYLNGALAGTTTETSLNLENLSPETEYTVTITTLIGEQESEQSEGIAFSTIQSPLEPPVKPEFKASYIYGTGTVKLSWSLDDPTISSWEVYMNDTLIYELPGGTNETIIRGLEDGDYDFKVRAVNSAGAGEYSEIITENVNNILTFVPKLGDIFLMIGMLFKSMWPLIAFALALIIVPRLSRYLITIVANK